MNPQQGMLGGQKILSQINGLKRLVNNCYKAEELDSKTFAGLLIHINQLHSRTTEFVRQQENEHLKSGGRFYEKDTNIHEERMMIHER